MISWVFLLCSIEQDSKLWFMSSILLGIFLFKFFNSVHLSWLGICKPTFIFPQHPYTISHQNYSILCHSISTFSEFPSLGKPIKSTDYMCVCINVSICLSIHPATVIYIHIYFSPVMERSLCGRVNIYAEVRTFSRYLKIFFFFKQHLVAY